MSHWMVIPGAVLALVGAALGWLLVVAIIADVLRRRRDSRKARRPNNFGT